MLLNKLKLNDLWDNQLSANRKFYQATINNRLKNYFREQWIESAKCSNKGLNYLELSLFNCERKPYLNFIMNDRSVNKMLKIRTGNHTLSTEVDRYRNRKTYEECICQACDTNRIEDLYHVFVECPKYSKFRLDSNFYWTAKNQNFIT